MSENLDDPAGAVCNGSGKASSSTPNDEVKSNTSEASSLIKNETRDSSLVKNEEECGDADVVVSMVDVLEEEEALQESAAAVLGASDDQNCTYLEGYVGRQALYSCLTCARAATAMSSVQVDAGVCLACSHECHEGHELVELYTKRHFRCDCGNSKFSGNPCKLCPTKEAVNIDNRYNQNFHGLYCSCSRPYPDPDDTTEDVMLQCVLCEDWFHLRHVCKFTVDTDDYDEMICGQCMSENHILAVYAHLCKGACDPRNKSGSTESCEEDSTVDVTEVNGNEKSSDEAVNTSIESIGNDKSVDGATVKPTEASSSYTASEAELKLVETSRTMQGLCKLEQINQVKASSTWIGPVFWPASWRSELCRCTKCLDVYAEKRIAYLLDAGDSIQEYERRGKEKVKCSTYEQGMKALSSLDRVQQIELMHGYADMKSELQEYLKKFIDNQKVVRSEDINEFFTQLEARKRRRIDTSISQNYKE